MSTPRMSPRIVSSRTETVGASAVAAVVAMSLNRKRRFACLACLRHAPSTFRLHQADFLPRRAMRDGGGNLAARRPVRNKKEGLRALLLCISRVSNGRYGVGVEFPAPSVNRLSRDIRPGLRRRTANNMPAVPDPAMFQ